jgi:hypothetical protein
LDNVKEETSQGGPGLVLLNGRLKFIEESGLPRAILAADEVRAVFNGVRA